MADELLGCTLLQDVDVGLGIDRPGYWQNQVVVVTEPGPSVNAHESISLVWACETHACAQQLAALLLRAAGHHSIARRAK